jgi:hypothetical protein
MTTPDDPRYWRECAEAMSRMVVIVAHRLSERQRDLAEAAEFEEINGDPETAADFESRAYELSPHSNSLAYLVARLDEITKNPTSLPIDVERALKEYEQS